MLKERFTSFNCVLNINQQTDVSNVYPTGNFEFKKTGLPRISTGDPAEKR